ncbi:MAG: glycosyltransferase [Flavobacteriaceae bacterium]
MKILMLSMGSIHFFRWAEQLKDSGLEIFWFDILDGGVKSPRLDWADQKVGWKKRFDYPGRIFLKNKIPFIHKFIQFFNDKKTSTEFEHYLNEVKPDVVHSFVMYMSCFPILEVMKKNLKIKWIYSAWGNDLYYYKNVPKRLSEIKETLPHINYMFADCTRDFHIARELGFKGEYLGTFPTGGGYELNEYKPYKKELEKRNTILIKGYQHKFGRANKVLEAIALLKKLLNNYLIVVYAANEEVSNKVLELNLNNWENFTFLGQIPHKELLKIKGKTLIYIGNSISDGTPNTLLEAFIMGAFPIQSNPGGATTEWITHKKNGLLLEDPENTEAIADQIAYALSHPKMLQDGIDFNTNEIIPLLEREYVRENILEKYNKIESTLQLC